MRKSGKILGCCLITVSLLACTACSGFDRLSDNLKDGVEQLSNDVVIGKSNALITPYQSFEGSRTSDSDAFQATYDASVMCFDGQDILVGDTNLSENECREVTIQYSFVTVQLQTGANYIGIVGTDYSGAILVAIK